MTSDTHCIHLQNDPNQAQAAIHESNTVIHDCAVCAADRLTMSLKDESPADTVRRVNFRMCPHYNSRDGARRCGICFYGVLGAVLLRWAGARSQTKESTREANRQLRLFQLLISYQGGPGILGRLVGEQLVTEKAIPVNQLETRTASDGIVIGLPTMWSVAE